MLAVSLSGLEPDQRATRMQAEALAAQRRLDPRQARMLQAVWFDDGADSRLLLTAHHLVVDGVSWRILVPDLQSAYAQACSQHDRAAEDRLDATDADPGSDPGDSSESIVLAPVPTSLREWALALPAAAERRLGELPLWRSMLEGERPDWFARALDPRRDTQASARSLSLSLDPATTACLLNDAPERINGRINDVLLTGFLLAAAQWRRGRDDRDLGELHFDLEGHGRETAAAEGLIDGADLSRTLGWFTSLFPVRLRAGEFDPEQALREHPAMQRALKSVKEQLRQVPDHGIGYGLLRHLQPQARAELAALAPPLIGFNYLGRFAAAAGASDDPAAADWSAGDDPGSGLSGFGGGSDDSQPLAHALDLNALVLDGADGPRLIANWSWAGELLDEAQVGEFAQAWFHALRRIADFAAQADGAALTPSDVPMVALDQSDIELLESLYAQLSD